ncbi:hypothetical protein B0H34DRAFT_73474 [Crassisporium funariophilum]|nr:hypothetical protein B0H34DRAFT_73474 [Crassisporium funariophilum]
MGDQANVKMSMIVLQVMIGTSSPQCPGVFKNLEGEAIKGAKYRLLAVRDRISLKRVGMKPIRRRRSNPYVYVRYINKWRRGSRALVTLKPPMNQKIRLMIALRLYHVRGLSFVTSRNVVMAVWNILPSEDAQKLQSMCSDPEPLMCTEPLDDILALLRPGDLFRVCTFASSRACRCLHIMIFTVNQLDHQNAECYLLASIGTLHVPESNS